MVKISKLLIASRIELYKIYCLSIFFYMYVIQHKRQLLYVNNPLSQLLFYVTLKVKLMARYHVGDFKIITILILNDEETAYKMPTQT